MSKVNLNDYICKVPFKNLEIQDHSRFLCCASWLTKFLPEDTSPKDSWNSDEANEIRRSVMDGSYKYCDKNQCPFLHQLTEFGDVGDTRTFIHKSKLTKEFKKTLDEFERGELVPVTVQFSFDRSCNLKCPSCRVEVFSASSKKIKEVKTTIEIIEEQYGKTIKNLYITGSGDPFVSVGFRDFMRNFDKSKWPSLQHIHLHTNATRWTKKMWDSMSNIHPYVKTCEISIDAATKETYETKTRIGGNWDELMDNLKFISTIPTLNKIKTSFVVQKHNYKEMVLFKDLMTQMFGNRVNIFFGKITNWGTYTDEEFKDHQIWCEDHPDYGEFIKVLNKTLPHQKSFTNLQESIIPRRSLI
jgi:organic radical activating enzyme